MGHLCSEYKVHLTAFLFYCIQTYYYYVVESCQTYQMQAYLHAMHFIKDILYLSVYLDILKY